MKPEVSTDTLDLLQSDPERWVRDASLGEARRVREALAALAVHHDLVRTSREWVRVADVKLAFEKVLTGLRARLIAIPAMAAHLANPSDPALASKAMMQAINQTLAEINGREIADSAVAARAVDDARTKRGRKPRGVR
jgi:hypothetical protein